MIIAIDFDGTIVEHKYPYIGEPIPLAIETMRELIENGNDLILWTVRSGEALREAVDYCESHGVHFWGVNENPTQKYWAGGHKAYAAVYIDDAALGCPCNDSGVDWSKVREELWKLGALKKRD